jgi:hypothetical protein
VVILGVILGTMVLHVTASILADIKWPNNQFSQVIGKVEVVGSYFVVVVLVGTLFNPDISKYFIFSTMVLYGSIIFVAGHHIRELLARPNLMFRLLIISLSCLILIDNVQSFALLQFGKLPKRFGGGKPETAYVKFSPQHSGLATALNIPVVTNLALSDGFVGPIAILLRSDKEILFLNLADLNSSLYVTNDVVTSMRTNMVATMTTNLAGGIVSRRTENLRTKAIAQIEVRLQTNVVVNITRNVRMDVPQITAKQLRTDLVDALIFAKTLFEN